MARFTCQLDPNTHKVLSAVSYHLGIPKVEILRQALSQYVRELAAKDQKLRQLLELAKEVERRG